MARPPARRVGLLLSLAGLLVLLGSLLISGMVGGSSPGAPPSSPLERVGPSVVVAAQEHAGAGRAPSPRSLSSPPALTGAPPAAGWATPRGGPSLNASTVDYAPEPQPLTGAPANISVSLGRGADNASGFVVSPGGTLVVELGNETLCALNASTLKVEWWSNVSRPLVGGPSLAGGLVYAVDRSGDVFAWDLAQPSVQAIPAWVVPTGGSSAGATPLPYGGSLYVVTGTALTVLNASTGAMLNRNVIPALDPSHAPSYGAGYLYAQARTGADPFLTISALGANVSAAKDGIAGPGAAMFSDHDPAVAGPNGTLSGAVVGGGYWFRNISLPGAPLSAVLPLAGSHGDLFATDGRGPLFLFNETDPQAGTTWHTPSWVSSPATVAGSQVLVADNDSVEAFNITSGPGPLSPAWVVPTEGEVTLPLADSDGMLYALTGTGNLTEIGSSPLTLSLTARPRAAQGSPVEFSSTTAGGVGARTSVDWLFSDGGAASGAVVSHTFNEQGPAWAEAVATDTQGVSTPVAQLPITILAPWTVTLFPRGSVSGPAPLYLNLSAIPSGGNGTGELEGIGFQVQGVQPEWVPSESYGLNLVLTRPGTDTIIAWANDTAGDSNTSNPLTVVVGAATPPAPQAQLFSLGPGKVEITWGAPSTPGFVAWFVNATQDGAPVLNAVITDPATTSLLLAGLSMGSNVSVTVARATSFGPVETGAPVGVTTTLVAPTLGVNGASGFPGQAELTWALAAPIDHFQAWVLLEIPQGATRPTNTTLPSYVTATNDSYVTPPLPDLQTTALALAALLSDGKEVVSGSVAFTPAWPAPSLELVPSGLSVNATWSFTSVPDFSHVVICVRSVLGSPPMGAGPPTCPVTSLDPLSPAAGISFTLPASGMYLVNLTAYAENGFVMAGPAQAINVTAPAVAPWYAGTAAGVPFWAWSLLVLLLFAFLVSAYLLFREHRDIPPYLGEVLPWDPLAPELSPHARPKSPETLESEPRLHRHPASHSHRHLRRHRNEVAEDEGTGAGAGAAAPVKKGGSAGSEEEETGEAPARKAAARRPPAEAEPGEEAEEGAPMKGAPPAARPSGGRQAPTGRPAGRATPEGDEEEAAASGELRKLPIVLRHEEDGPEGGDEEEGPPLRSPASKRPAPAPAKGAPGGRLSAPAKAGRDAEDDAGEGEDAGAAAPPAPKRSPPKPKTEEDAEPTL